jgi:hypothetical protein
MEVGNFGGSLNTTSMNFNTGGTIRLESTGIGNNGAITITNAGPINLTTTGIITVGGPASVSIAPSMTTGNFVNIGGTGSNSNSGLKVFQPITVNYGSNWAIPTTNQIGQTINGSGASASSLTVPLTVRFFSLNAGVYYISANVNYSSQTTWNVTSISFVNNAHNYGCAQYGGNPYVNWGVNLSMTWTVPSGSSQTVCLIVQSSVQTAIGAVVFTATRIA